MHRSFTSAATLLTLLPTVLAAGSAHVVNNCGIDVYYASVAQNVHSSMQKLPPGGYSESFNKVNVGVSIKLAATLNGPVTQFEFTWDSPNINYDISNIDGNPFAQQGTSLVPSMAGAAGYPTCIALNCPAGQSRCDAAYNLPDDVRTMVCPDDSDLTFTLCPGGAVAAPPAAASSKVSSAISIPASSAVVSQPIYTTRVSAMPAVPTSFKTSTTPAANVPVASSSQDEEPIAPTTASSVPAAALTTQVGQPATTPAPVTVSAWTWTRGSGGWGHHQHTRRAHMHHFDS